MDRTLKKAPDVTVRLVGEDGNPFTIIGKVNKALRSAGHKELAAEYMKEAVAGDYDHLLAVTMDYVNVK